MNEDIQKDLKVIQEKLTVMEKEVVRLKTYFSWTFWITIVIFVLPLLLALIALPKMISTYLDMINGLGTF